MKLNTGEKEIQQVNPGGPDKQPKYQAPTISSIDKSLSRNRQMVGSISRKLLTELGIRTEDAECKLMGDIYNFVNLVLIIKIV